jgi:hypothetical protein
VFLQDDSVTSAPRISQPRATGLGGGAFSPITTTAKSCCRWSTTKASAGSTCCFDLIGRHVEPTRNFCVGLSMQVGELRRDQCLARPALPKPTRERPRDATVEHLAAADAHVADEAEVGVARWPGRQPWGDDVHALARDERDELAAVLNRDHLRGVHAAYSDMNPKFDPSVAQPAPEGAAAYVSQFGDRALRNIVLVAQPCAGFRGLERSVVESPRSD